MSTKAYIEASKLMTDEQHDIMYDLFMEGVNFEDGHVYVTYTQVEDAVAKLIMAGRKEKE